MKSSLYTNIVLTVIALLLAGLLLQNAGIIHTPIKEVSGSVSIDGGNVTVDGDVEVSGEVKIDDMYPVEVTIR